MVDNTFSEISVTELAKLIAADHQNQLQLIDVRELKEITIARLPKFVVLSLSQFAEWSETIESRFDCEKQVIVLCHHGRRSAQMCQWLVARGFRNVINVSGGIDAYSALVDSNVPQYQ